VLERNVHPKIASDFGKKLHSGATLIALRRTVSGAYRIEDAKSVDEWIRWIESESGSEKGSESESEREKESGDESEE